MQHIELKKSPVPFTQNFTKNEYNSQEMSKLIGTNP